MSKQASEVLLVEDEAGVARMIRRQLEDEGISCDVVDTKKAALQAIIEKTYLIILLDGNLSPEISGHDGVEIAEAIRASSINTLAYIINISGSSENPAANERIPKREIFRLKDRVIEVRQELLTQRDAQ